MKSFSSRVHRMKKTLELSPKKASGRDGKQGRPHNSNSSSNRKKEMEPKELTKEEFQSRLREEVIGGGFKSDKANELAMNGKEDIPKKKPLPPPNSEWDKWWGVTIVTLIIPTHDIDGNEIPGVESPVK
jgi:hypothetical protein